MGGKAMAQFGPLSVKTKFQSPDSLYRYSLQTAQVPDSTRLNLMKVRCKFVGPYSEVYWAVSNAGAILAFRDSLLKMPLFLEKRNVYPFVQLNSKSRYWLEITRSNGKDGYLAARLLDDKSKEVIDEVFLCLSQTDLKIQAVDVIPASWIFHKK